MPAKIQGNTISQVYKEIRSDTGKKPGVVSLSSGSLLGHAADNKGGARRSADSHQAIRKALVETVVNEVIQAVSWKDRAGDDRGMQDLLALAEAAVGNVLADGQPVTTGQLLALRNTALRIRIDSKLDVSQLADSGMGRPLDDGERDALRQSAQPRKRNDCCNRLTSGLYTLGRSGSALAGAVFWLPLALAHHCKRNGTDEWGRSTMLMAMTGVGRRECGSAGTLATPEAAAARFKVMTGGSERTGSLADAHFLRNAILSSDDCAVAILHEIHDLLSPTYVSGKYLPPGIITQGSAGTIACCLMQMRKTVLDKVFLTPSQIGKVIVGLRTSIQVSEVQNPKTPRKSFWGAMKSVRLETPPDTADIRRELQINHLMYKDWGTKMDLLNHNSERAAAFASSDMAADPRLEGLLLADLVDLYERTEALGYDYAQVLELPPRESDQDIAGPEEPVSEESTPLPDKPLPVPDAKGTLDSPAPLDLPVAAPPHTRRLQNQQTRKPRPVAPMSQAKQEDVRRRYRAAQTRSPQTGVIRQVAPHHRSSKEKRLSRHDRDASGLGRNGKQWRREMAREYQRAKQERSLGWTPDRLARHDV